MFRMADLKPIPIFTKRRGVWWANWGDDCALANHDKRELVQAVAKAQGVKK